MKKQIEDLSAFTVIERRRITDLNSEGYILKHKKTGANITLLLNDDENKCFISGFAHPPRTALELPIFWSIPFSVALSISR